MARAATTSDVFNAIAEPARRNIVGLLAGKELEVQALADRLELTQPAVSKHLRVLRAVRVVHVRQRGRHRLYSANFAALKPVRDWVDELTRFWDAQLDRVQWEAERRAGRTRHSTPRKEES